MYMSTFIHNYLYDTSLHKSARYIGVYSGWLSIVFFGPNPSVPFVARWLQHLAQWPS
jgi:hypothetical protein